MTLATDLTPGPSENQVTNWLRNRLAAVANGVVTHRTLYAIGLATYCIGLLLNKRLGEPVNLELGGIVSSMTLLGMLLISLLWLLMDFVKLYASGHGGSPSVAMLRTILVDILSPGRISNALHALLCTGLFAVGFTNIKSDIPRIDPFSWDETLMQLDRTLHLGMLPHEILAPLLGTPIVIFLLNVIYNLWFFIMMGFLIWQGCQGQDTPRRQQFLLAYMLCWGLGTAVMGLIFSSAGPCYFGRLVNGPDPYAGLMSDLVEANRHYPVFALIAQDLLWQSYLEGRGVVSGISAMPSMHVATSCLLFLCARASGPHWLSWSCAAFGVVIFAGSVMLGWHYAVDGYAGILIALLAWWLAGRLAEARFSGAGRRT